MQKPAQQRQRSTKKYNDTGRRTARPNTCLARAPRWAETLLLALSTGIEQMLLLATMHHWPRGVTVSTLDSESSDRGSNPREAFSNQDGPDERTAFPKRVFSQLWARRVGARGKKGSMAKGGCRKSRKSVSESKIKQTQIVSTR